MAALLILLILLALGAATLTGRTADSRDAQYSVGPLLRRSDKRVRP